MKSSCILSSAPERACSPMSDVPPSPAIPTEIILFFFKCPFLIRAFNPDAIPAATAAAFSKVTCIHGTLHAVNGSGDDTISMHPVALAMTISLPSALRTWRTASASAHP